MKRKRSFSGEMLVAASDRAAGRVAAAAAYLQAVAEDPSRRDDKAWRRILLKCSDHIREAVQQIRDAALGV